MTSKVDFKTEFNRQRATVTDITDPMNNLITKQEPEKRTTIGYRRPPKKTRRVQLLMSQELYDNAKSIADEDGISFNDFIGILCAKEIQKRTGAD